MSIIHTTANNAGGSVHDWGVAASGAVRGFSFGVYGTFSPAAFRGETVARLTVNSTLDETVFDLATTFLGQDFFSTLTLRGMPVVGDVRLGSAAAIYSGSAGGVSRWTWAGQAYVPDLTTYQVELV